MWSPLSACLRICLHFLPAVKMEVIELKYKSSRQKKIYKCIMLRKITEHSFSIMKINVDVHTQMPFPQHQLYHSVCHIGISCSTGHTGPFLHDDKWPKCYYSFVWESGRENPEFEASGKSAQNLHKCELHTVTQKRPKKQWRGKWNQRLAETKTILSVAGESERKAFWPLNFLGSWH